MATVLQRSHHSRGERPVRRWLLWRVSKGLQEHLTQPGVGEGKSEKASYEQWLFLPSLAFFLRSPMKKQHLKVTDAITAKQQNSLNTHTPSWDCTQLTISLHQWWQQLSLWDDVHYKQIWTCLPAASRGTSRGTVLLGWEAAVSWTHWLSCCLWVFFLVHMTKARNPGCWEISFMSHWMGSFYFPLRPHGPGFWPISQSSIPAMLSHALLPSFGGGGLLNTSLSFKILLRVTTFRMPSLTSFSKLN